MELISSEEEALVRTSQSSLRVLFPILSTMFETCCSVSTVSSSWTYSVKWLNDLSEPVDPAAEDMTDSMALPSIAPTTSTPSTSRTASTTWSAVAHAVSLSVPSGMVTWATMVLLDIEGIMLMPMLNTPTTENANRPTATSRGKAL